MSLKKPQQDLVKWTKEEWMTSGTNSNQKKGSSKEVKSEGKKRYLPKEAWSKLSSSEKAATNKAKAKGNKSGKQFVKQPPTVAKKAAQVRNKSK
jgi:hypothetical protein